MPRTVKQYYRALLVKLGKFDETTFKLAIDEIYPDDTFIVSYPKSGNTWVRFLIAHLITSGKEIDSNNIDAFVPDVYTARESADALPRPRFIKTHDAWFEGFPKSIYIVRDYRDVLISFYHYQVGLKGFSGSFTEFLSEVDKPHSFGTWKKHVEKALSFRATHPDRLLLLRYEDLHDDTTSCLQRIIDFTGLQTKTSIPDAIAASRFSALRKKEDATGSDFRKKSGEHFFREGKKGGWKNVFTPEQLKIVMEDQQHAELLKQLGYEV